MWPASYNTEGSKIPSELHLPPSWLSDTTGDLSAWAGRTGTFPAVRSAAYHDGQLIGLSEPSNVCSSLLRLLREQNDLTHSVIVCPIEPEVGESSEIAHLAIVKGVRSFVFGALHPSPSLRGQVTDILKGSGLAIYDLAQDALVSEVDRRFWVWAAYGRSYVHLKISLSREGMIVPVVGQKSHMAGPESKKRIHRLRGIYDGLLVGAATVRMYDSQMTYRGDEGLSQPKKIILSTSGILDAGLAAFKGEAPIISSETDTLKLTRELGRKNITGILVEGGYRVYRWFIEQRTVDEVSLVWTGTSGGPTGLMLPAGIPYGSLRNVGDDMWENIRWPASREARRNPHYV